MVARQVTEAEQEDLYFALGILRGVAQTTDKRGDAASPDLDRADTVGLDPTAAGQLNDDGSRLWIVVVSKGGDREFLHLQTGSAGLLPRLIVRPERGPLFFAERPPVASHVPAEIDLCPVTGRASPTGARRCAAAPATAIMLLR
jgi:hypothetical protein